jgi:hypothetical protein
LAKIHITLIENWKKVKEGGFLVPKKELWPNATGNDIDKVSAFYGIDIHDVDVLRSIRAEVARLKNQNTQTNNSEEDYIILEIICPDIEWVQYTNEEIELIHPFGQLPKDVYERLGGYCKTHQSIPSNCLREISL